MLDDDPVIRLIRDAAAHRLTGWDWSFIRGRWDGVETPWSYRDAVSFAAAASGALIDLDTGGGEFLISLPSLPDVTVATEAYTPNIPVARDQLIPRGVTVVAANPVRLPFRNESFDLAMSRHGVFRGSELHRVLAPSGQFITQQVGPANFQELNEFLTGSRQSIQGPTFHQGVADLADAGFVIDETHHALIPTSFRDVGAIAFYLLAVPWQIPGFDPLAERTRMRAIHDYIAAEGRFSVTAERYFIRAHRL